jgi:hypothetical protein
MGGCVGGTLHDGSMYALRPPVLLLGAAHLVISAGIGPQWAAASRRDAGRQTHIVLPTVAWL